MPIKDEDWPLRVNDHVLLDRDYGFPHEATLGSVALVIPAGSGGMVRKVDDMHKDIDFGHHRLRMQSHAAKKFLTLYRKAEAAS